MLALVAAPPILHGVRIASAVLLLLVAGCVANPPAGSSEATVTASASPTAGAATGSTAIPIAVATPELSAGLSLELVAEGLDLPSSIAATADGTLYINETRSGLIRIVDPDEGLLPQAFLDLSDGVRGDGERGLLGLAFHPNYDESGRLFVHYTRASDGAIIVSEFSRAEDGASADPSSERVLLAVEHPSAYHNGGQLEFGPDGYLYVALGDGGTPGDAAGHGQDSSTLLGAILRIDVDVDTGLRPYAIPADNPFVDGGGAPEVYVFGLRNPWRFSFDAGPDRLWVADVGDGAYDEVNRVDRSAAAGANLGWNIMEGNHCFNLVPCDPDAFVSPLTEYGRELGCAVIGGYVYRGDEIPGLHGWYVFADYCTGSLLGIPADASPPEGSVVRPQLLLATGLAVSTLGRGSDGWLYVADILGGSIYRLVAAPPGV